MGDVRVLDVYAVTETARRETLVQLATESGDRGRWVRFGSGLPEVTEPLLSLESGLVQLRGFQNRLVHGLSQTPDHARAVMTAVTPGRDSSEELERRVAARMIRRHVLRKQPPPHLRFILDQGILERPVGGRSVMREQVRRLLDLADSPDTDLRILPVEAGGSPRLVGPFSILTLPDPIPDICYAEGPAGTFYLEDREHVRTCTLRFGILTELALSRVDSVNMMTKAMKSYE